MKIELGGGPVPDGAKCPYPGYTNLDANPLADIVIDLDVCPLPFDDNSIEAVYSAHCLEHLKYPHSIMEEILRVCKVGALVEIHVPHWNHPNAMGPGHLHIISDRQFETWVQYPERHWPKLNKRFNFTKPIHYQHDIAFEEYAQKFQQLGIMKAEAIIKYFPACCHEIHVFMEVADRR